MIENRAFLVLSSVVSNSLKQLSAGLTYVGGATITAACKFVDHIGLEKKRGSRFQTEIGPYFLSLKSRHSFHLMV